jgi:hypothetical protein
MTTVLRNRASSSNISITSAHCRGVSSGAVIAKPVSSSWSSSVVQSSRSKVGRSSMAR